MSLRIPLFFFLFFFPLWTAEAQTVLFDGLVHKDKQAAVLLIPAVVTSDDYSALGRLEYGVADRVNIFTFVGGEFNGGPTGLAGIGWAGTFYRETDAFPLNFGFFNSFTFPLKRRGPDAFVTVAPVFSHTWDRKVGGHVTPYGGATATFKIDGRGTEVNVLLGVKVSEIAKRWDFVAEVQPGEKPLFAVSFVFRLTD